MTLRQKQSLFVRLVAHLVDWATEEGYELTYGETYRTDYQQAEYLRTGASRARRSRHQDKLAVDFNLFIGGTYQRSTEAYAPLGAFWKSLHPDCRWGGDFPAPKDGNHFEMVP